MGQLEVCGGIKGKVKILLVVLEQYVNLTEKKKLRANGGY